MDCGKLVHRLLELGQERSSEVEGEVVLRLGAITKQIQESGDITGNLMKVARAIEENWQKAQLITSIYWSAISKTASDAIAIQGRELKVSGVIEVDTSDGPLSIPVEGTIDRLDKEISTSKLWVRDFKSTSRDAATAFIGYEYSLQPRMYRLLTKLHTGTEPTGFILDILTLPNIKLASEDRAFTEEQHTLKSGPRKGEVELRRNYNGPPLFSNYLTRCRKWYGDNGKEPLTSMAIMFNEPLLSREFGNSLIYTFKSLTQPAIPENYPRDITSHGCVSLYGNVCDYYPLCKTPPHSWDELLENEYQVEAPSELEPTDSNNEDSNI
jgi:hypothetical protein